VVYVPLALLNVSNEFSAIGNEQLEDKSFRATLTGYVVELRQQLKKGDRPVTVTHYEPLFVTDPAESNDNDLIYYESGKYVSHAEYLYSLMINSHAGKTLTLSTMVLEIERILETPPK
jgi:hypothetical protein